MNDFYFQIIIYLNLYKSKYKTSWVKKIDFLKL